MARRVGIIGIGIMGTAMMRNLAREGFEVVGYDIAEAAMARLAEAGGTAANSPRDVAEHAEEVNAPLLEIYKELPELILKRFGEVSDPTEELIK